MFSNHEIFGYLPINQTLIAQSKYPTFKNFIYFDVELNDLEAEGTVTSY
jgi:hypothetical protein